MREVAAQVGMNGATLHHYFPTKERLIQAVVEYVIARLSLAFTDLSGTPAEQLLCSALSITPLEFLTAKTLPSQQIPKSIVDNVRVESWDKGKPVSADDVQNLRQVLEAAIAERRDSSSNLREVANAIDCPVAIIHRYCPDLSKRISARSQRRWTEEDYHRMKQELENALKSDEPVSLTTVAKKLGCNDMLLRRRFPDLCRAVVTRYRQRFDYAQIQRRLQVVLASDEQPPSVEELARERGCKSHILWAHFPDLCNEVVQRRSTERQKQHDERIAIQRHAIRQAVFLLHSRGEYPSAWKASRQLDTAYGIGMQEGREAWLLTLEELGYPTGHLKKYS